MYNHLKNKGKRLMKDLIQQLETIREKANLNSQQLSRAIEQGDATSRRVHVLEDDKASLESRLSKVEAELAAAEVARDAFRRDKSIVSGFFKIISLNELLSGYSSSSASGKATFCARAKKNPLFA
jgi:chromosome segregation ATPase